jgi:predicted secreted Zn-dependent protease
LARRLRALPEFESCAALNAEIVKTRARVNSEYRMLDEAYDRVETLYAKGFQ